MIDRRSSGFFCRQFEKWLPSVNGKTRSKWMEINWIHLEDTATAEKSNRNQPTRKFAQSQQGSDVDSFVRIRFFSSSRQLALRDFHVWTVHHRYNFNFCVEGIGERVTKQSLNYQFWLRYVWLELTNRCGPIERNGSELILQLCDHKSNELTSKVLLYMSKLYTVQK